jgi:hypothetical protein
MKKKIYIGCALTHLPADKREDFLKMVFKVRKDLEQHFEVLSFLGVDDLLTEKPFTPKEIYNYDIQNCLMKADYFLAICDYYGLGLGYEIGAAVEGRGMPVLAIAHRDSPVSRLVLGIDHKNYHFARYDSPDEIVPKVLEILIPLEV